MKAPANALRHFRWLPLAGVLLTAAAGAGAQQAAVVARIGYLSPLNAESDAENRASFQRGLRELGYEEGRNLRVVARHAEGNLERLSEFAVEIARQKVDVIVAATTPAVRAAQKATTTIPIVMAFAGDPVGDGLVASLAHPGGNTTGISAAVTELAAKRVEYLQALVPKVSHVLLLATPTASRSMVSATESAGRALGVRVTSVKVSGAGDVARAFSGASGERFEAVIVDLAIRQHVTQILELARHRGMATVSGPREFVLDGGLLAYGANYPDLFRRSASYVDRILRGARPADLPVEQPTNFRLVVNLKAARALGLTIPASLRARADELLGS